MPITRFALALCCALLQLPAWAQRLPPQSQPLRSLRGDRAKPPTGGTCGSTQGATCQINAQVFDFGRGQMSSTDPAINGNTTVSVTCTRGREAQDLDVQVDFYLSALPIEPARYMRDNRLSYLRYFIYVDPARTRYWGDGTAGSFNFPGTLFLDNRNPVGTLVFPVYGKVEAGQSQVLPGQWLGAILTRLEYQVTCR
jgi:spore coat protein U-like protein